MDALRAGMDPERPMVESASRNLNAIPIPTEAAAMQSRWKFVFSIATCTVLALASSCSKHPTKPAAGQVTPSPLVFGSVMLGSSADQSFTIKNAGGGRLSGTVGAGSGAFTVMSGGGSYSLRAGQEWPVMVRFAPTAVGAQQYVLPLGSSACADPTCTGTGTAGDMVFVPAGNFTMGSTEGYPGYPGEQPAHTVYLDAFYIDKYEVTNAKFKSFIDAGGYTNEAFWSAAGWAAHRTQPEYWSSGEYHSGPAWPDFPVVGISWYEAEAYAHFAGKRLPTEAEWEKAARGTDQRTYPWGTGLDGSRANYYGSGDPYDDSTTPVGFYDGRLHPSPPFQTTNSPSFYGAYDMAGNVWEWVADWYGETYYSVSPPSNPPGPLSGEYRVLRGGAWDFIPSAVRSACRNGLNSPQHRGYYIGFRCARTLP
jgi:formylglycine-generating enzyme required for sulfatase activity